MRFARRIALAPLLVLLLAAGEAALARGVYQEPAAFVAEAFGGEAPPPRVLWVTGALRERVSRILGHPPRFLRVRYWLRGGRSAWVLEEIGKEQPITVGVVIDGGRIERIRVLIFRESRGWEVREPFFTRQFEGARLRGGDRLDRPIDGISGATLSVRALTRIARVALVLHERVAGGGP